MRQLFSLKDRSDNYFMLSLIMQIKQIFLMHTSAKSVRSAEIISTQSFMFLISKIKGAKNGISLLIR
ncbi:hypothetical protein EG339_09785 [Chryseobacterium bernardetii]|uniref:Uncharacterized protein n=1 Tax=Chryseobacterium bernardetii TaxID=1241978 RepID=A0A3G6TAD2_9FLAO|nr:hypothetical protein EG339_09785 [Chryseobacterium bernardetii]